MVPKPVQKWRPTLGMIVVAVLMVVLTLPLAGLFLFRLLENQLIHEAESELIGQNAVLAAAMGEAFKSRQTINTPRGGRIPATLSPDPEALYHPIVPQLDLARDPILGPRGDPRPSSTPIHPAFSEIGKIMGPLIRGTQDVTLAGFRILDPNGTVIAGRAEIGQSLAHVPEVDAALNGSHASALRHRMTDQPRPPVKSVSRGTEIRVFVATPVIVEDHVIGVIYSSRTPSNILRQLYQQRHQVLLAALFVFAVTVAIAFIFSRAITGPIHELIRRTALIGRGERAAISPLKRHGSREIVELSQAFLAMSDTLSERADYISSFASHVSHELKSPLTSIQGAAELLRDSGATMSAERRAMFLDNIMSDTRRLTQLVDRLRVLAIADNPQREGITTIANIAAQMRDAHPDLTIDVAGDSGAHIAMAQENATVVFSNLIDNARQHQADHVTLRATSRDGEVVVTVRDNGTGISAGNAERIFDLFFTTRRECGGTGMGLGIVRSMLKTHKGRIAFRPGGPGATFVIALPRTLR